MSDRFRSRDVSKYGTTTYTENEAPLIKDLADQLQLDYKRLTLDVINGYSLRTSEMKSDFGNNSESYYEDMGQTFPDDLFPNIEQVFIEEIDKIAKEVTVSQSPLGAVGVRTHTIETRLNKVERAKQQRVSDYFYKEVDYTKEGSFDLFLAYLKKTNDINYESLSQIDSLSFEQIQKIVMELKSEKNTFVDINLFMKFPKLYTKEKALEILQEEWFEKYSCERNFSHNDLGGYLVTCPSHIGMSEENVVFRKKLDSAYKELTQKSIYDIKFDDETYFDKLCAIALSASAYSDYNQDLVREARNEIAYEHLDKFISRQKEAKNVRLVYILELDSNGEIKNTPTNEKIISALEEVVNKENQKEFFGTDKGRAYVWYQLLNHNLKNDDMEVFQGFDDGLITKAFVNRDKISDDYVQKIYQVVWFYNKGGIKPEILRSEYKSKFLTDIDDDVSNIKWRYFPIGSRWFDYLLSARAYRMIAKYHPDEFMNLPLEKLNEHFSEIHLLCCNDNFEILDQDLLALKQKCIKKYGVENLSLTEYDFEFLGYRYLHGIRNECEINFLRKYNRECSWCADSLLEREFNKEGRTLYTIADLPNLISYNREDKINLVLKDGYVVDNEAQKYGLFNELVNKTYKGAQKDEKYATYLDNLLKHNDINVEKAKKYEHFEIYNMIDFCVDMCHKDNSSIYKPYIQRLVQKARDEGNGYIVESRLSELQQIGIKVHYTQDLISYEKRGIRVDYSKNHELYDFNEKFLCEASYHHSDGSHTTFLNEMLWYGDQKGAVLALNNGASPFTKAGFFRDKFEAMPFNMFFNRELKNNNEAGLKDFMVYIASHINEGKGKVLQDIWTSLGKQLRDRPEVKSIIVATEKTFNDSVKERKDRVVRAKEEQRLKQHQENLLNLQRNVIKEVGDYVMIAGEDDMRQAITGYMEAHGKDLPFVPTNEEQTRILEAMVAEKEHKIAEQQKALKKLEDQVKRFIGDELINSSDAQIVQMMGDYMKENKDNLPVLPNEAELIAMKQNLLDERDVRLKNCQREDNIATQYIYECVNKLINSYGYDNNYDLPPNDVISESIDKYIENDRNTDAQALRRVRDKTEKNIILRLEKERHRDQKADDKFEDVAAKVLNKFYNSDESGGHGDTFFNSVGKERRRNAYNHITCKVMERLGLNANEDDVLPAIQEQRFNRYHSRIVDFENDYSSRGYYGEGDYTSQKSSQSTQSASAQEPTLDGLANLWGANLSKRR